MGPSWYRISCPTPTPLAAGEVDRHVRKAVEALEASPRCWVRAAVVSRGSRGTIRGVTPKKREPGQKPPPVAMPPPTLYMSILCSPTNFFCTQVAIAVRMRLSVM